METALRQELETKIEELKPLADGTGFIFPTNAPEGVTRPYLVYARISTDIDKTLEGYENTGSISYMFSIMASRYSDMVRIRNEIEETIKAMPKKRIGEQRVYIKDININNVTEQYEHELKVNRGIIDFTIFY